MYQRDIVLEALAAVCRDLDQVGESSDGIELIVDGERIWITRNGEVNGSALIVYDDDDAMLVEVADAVQYLVSYGPGDRVWPVCPVHRLGLHPELEHGHAAWVCRPHQHVVAPIGKLAE